MVTSAYTASSEPIVVPIHTHSEAGDRRPRASRICVDALLLRRVGRAAGRRRRAAARGRLGVARRADLDAERLHRLAVELPGGLHALRVLEVAERLLSLRSHPAVDAARMVSLVLERLLDRLHLLVARHRHDALAATARPARLHAEAGLHPRVRLHRARRRIAHPRHLAGAVRYPGRAFWLLD